jgi:electron transfer flavoprotein alpha subunit
MPASGKNKENSLNCKLKKAVSRSNSSKKKHLLLKPNSSHCKHSVSKFANSSSTLHSNNISKVSSHQKNSVKPREIVSQSLIKEITAADKKLNETLYILECSVDNSEAKWFEAVEGIGR